MGKRKQMMDDIVKKDIANDPKVARLF